MSKGAPGLNHDKTLGTSGEARAVVVVSGTAEVVLMAIDGPVGLGCCTPATAEGTVDVRPFPMEPTSDFIDRIPAGTADDESVLGCQLDAESELQRRENVRRNAIVFPLAMVVS